MDIKRIPLEEVVEVFAGRGTLGLRLGLKENCNISDSLLYAENGYEDDVNIHWERRPRGVVMESAYDTILRFYAEPRQTIRLLIMGAPLPSNSYYCPSYEAAKTIHYGFQAQILYIGEMPSLTFASPKFFRHVEEVEEDWEQSFKKFVKNNYDNSFGYFTSALFNKPIDVQPYLLKFKPCSDEKCDCRDGSKIIEDALVYFVKRS